MVLRTPANRFATRVAFTLMEMMIVVAIIVVLGGIAYVSYSSISEKGNDARIGSDLQTINKSVAMYFLEYSDYPGDISQLATPNAFGKVFIDAKFLKDPWGRVYNYKLGGGQNTAAGGSDPYDLWCEKDNWVIGNWTNFKKMPK